MTPLLTPYEDDLSIAEGLYLDHAAFCLEGGAHYLSPFGTTGEASSNTMSERMGVLEQLVASGTVPPEQLMPGTGLCNLEDTVTLTRHAADLGCAAAMVLPPFFYPPDDEGLYRYYGQLIETLGDKAPRIILYNIPQNTGVPISPALSARLNEAFPDHVVAYKDSSGDWDNTASVIRAAPGLSVFPASETLLARAMALGAGGCISASCNSNITAIRAMYEAVRDGDQSGADTLQPGLETHRKAAQEEGLICGLKSLVAHRSNDQRWLNLRPPHMNADPAAGPRLATTLPR
ncbi:dihydrodipicolinate synthase family protein [uncultured Ruegeria sp.]|uniref:dihydrodipicolinate synthase family protein n=1 Tax=uncultured Ruegeria sp. TaxID=259304 RepID=UPI00262ED8EA|nr:dihydrodipicolinate synthase family protein [uncultured Ruegeria sp.]